MPFQNHSVVEALQGFHKKFVTLYREQHQSLPQIEHDDEWVSPCEQAQVDSGDMVQWQPTECSGVLTFANIEHALGFPIHPDIQAFYCSFYCNNISATSKDGKLELLQTWNKDDFDRLQQNLLGHIMVKRKKKQAVTLFLGVTDHDEIIITINNDTGEIWAETAGQEPHKFLADNLASFIEELTPIID